MFNKYLTIVTITTLLVLITCDKAKTPDSVIKPYTGNLSNVTVTTPLTKYLDSLWPLDNLNGRELQDAKELFSIMDTIILPKTGDSMFIIRYPYSESGQLGEGGRSIVIHSNYSNSNFIIRETYFDCVWVRFLLDSTLAKHNHSSSNFNQFTDYLDELFTRGYNPTISMFPTLFETLLQPYRKDSVKIGIEYIKLTSLAQIDSIKAVLSQPKSYRSYLSYYNSKLPTGLDMNSVLSTGFEMATTCLPITDSSMVAIYYQKFFPSLTFVIIDPVNTDNRPSFDPFKLRAARSAFSKRPVYHGIYNVSAFVYF